MKGAETCVVTSGRMAFQQAAKENSRETSSTSDQEANVMNSASEDLSTNESKIGTAKSAEEEVAFPRKSGFRTFKEDDNRRDGAQTTGVRTPPPPASVFT